MSVPRVGPEIPSEVAINTLSEPSMAIEPFEPVGTGPRLVRSLTGAVAPMGGLRNTGSADGGQ